MKLRFYSLLVILITALPSVGHGETRDTGRIVVLSDPALSRPLAEIARHYAFVRRANINLSYGDSEFHAERIIAGEPADLLISTKPKWLAELRHQGLVDVYSQRPVTRGMLALVSAEHNKLVYSFTDSVSLPVLLESQGEESSFFMPHPELSGSGSAALESMAYYGFADDLASRYRFFDHAEEQLMAMREANGVGIALYTDARTTEGIRVIDIIPRKSYSAVRYEGVVVGGENMTAARKFLDYLTTKSAQDVFQKYGFNQE